MRFYIILYYITAHKAYFYSSVAQRCASLTRFEMDGVCFNPVLNEC